MDKGHGADDQDKIRSVVELLPLSRRRKKRLVKDIIKTRNAVRHDSDGAIERAVRAIRES